MLCSGAVDVVGEMSVSLRWLGEDSWLNVLCFHTTASIALETAMGGLLYCMFGEGGIALVMGALAFLLSTRK